MQERALGGFHTASIPDQTDEQLRGLLRALDGQDQTPAVRRLRAWALDLAAPRAGERAAEIGSGTGTVARLLAGHGLAVTGVEPNPKLRAVATERDRAAGATVDYLDGTVQALPFADGSLDLVWCERVLQHVADAQVGVVEIARVLRPGGRAVLLDTDHATRVVADVDPDVERATLDVFLARYPNPRAALHLPRQLSAAGLITDPDVGSAALIMPPSMLSDPVIIRATTDQAVQAGAITRDQADEAIATLQRAAADGVAFSAVTMFGFLARKPA